MKDCAKAMMMVLKDGSVGEVYNIGSGIEKRNIDVVKAILKILGKSERLIEFVKDRPGHDFRYSMNSAKIRRELKWTPQYGFEQGLDETVEWYLKNQTWLNNLSPQNLA